MFLRLNPAYLPLQLLDLCLSHGVLNLELDGRSSSKGIYALGHLNSVLLNTVVQSGSLYE